MNPYLNFNGNTEDAFNFYKSIFGGEFTALQRFGDAPNIPSHLKEKIMHISLPIGNGNILMGTDACEEMGFKLTQGNNFFILIDADTREQADKFFNALAEGGKVEAPLQDMFWGAYWGSLRDKFGTQWMLNYAKQQ